MDLFQLVGIACCGLVGFVVLVGLIRLVRWLRGE